MFRALTALGALALVAPAANAQPGNLPLSPGVMPGSPWGPGAPFRPAISMPARPGLIVGPGFAPWGYPGDPFFGFGFGYGSPFGYGYPYGGVVSPVPYLPAQPAITESPRRAEPVLAKEFPATLTLQFPSAAEVWLDGKKLDGAAAEERVVTSPVLKAGEEHTFAVTARWTTGGKTYEAKRSVKLGSGDRSRLFIVSGDEVK